MELVLSTFTGAGLLDMGFELEGFCVVSAGDSLWGRDVRSFQPARHKFEGIIGGPPCQDFSKARRCPPTGEGLAMVHQFARIVYDANPKWFLMENVPGVPDLSSMVFDTVRQGWKIQRFNINARECGLRQNRLRSFQWGSRDGSRLVIRRRVTAEGHTERCCLASEGRRANRRTFADFCELQGLPRTFLADSDLSQTIKYQLVGNGVPVPMARVIAGAIRDRAVTRWDQQLCVCDCGRPVKPGQTLATPACRKRMQRRRDAAVVTVPGPVTSGVSQPVLL